MSIRFRNTPSHFSHLKSVNGTSCVGTSSALQLFIFNTHLALRPPRCSHRAPYASIPTNLGGHRHPSIQASRNPPPKCGEQGCPRDRIHDVPTPPEVLNPQPHLTILRHLCLLWAHPPPSTFDLSFFRHPLCSCSEHVFVRLSGSLQMVGSHRLCGSYTLCRVVRHKV